MFQKRSGTSSPVIFLFMCAHSWYRPGQTPPGKEAKPPLCAASTLVLRILLCRGTASNPSAPEEHHSTVGLRKNGSRGIMQEVVEWEIPLPEKESCEEVQCVSWRQQMVSASSKCPEPPTPFRPPGTTLIFQCHQDDFLVSGGNVELTWLQENLGARLKLTPAEPVGPGSPYSYLRATRTRVDTIHIAPRETWTSWVSATTSANRCQPR